MGGRAQRDTYLFVKRYVSRSVPAPSRRAPTVSKPGFDSPTKPFAAPPVRQAKEKFVSTIRQSAAILALLAASACNVAGDEPAANQAGGNRAAAPASQPGDAQAPRLTQAQSDARAEYEGLRFVVDISDRKVRLLRGDRQLEEHDVAVGSQRWPTPTGSWTIHQVDINPDWNPPRDEARFH